MKINSISNVHCAPQNSLNFNGTIMTKGNWPKELAESFYNSKGINDLATGDKIVIGSLKTKNASMRDYNHYEGEEIYKLKLEIKDKNASFWKNVKNLFKRTSFIVNEHYHGERGMTNILKSRTKESYLEKMSKQKLL